MRQSRFLKKWSRSIPLAQILIIALDTCYTRRADTIKPKPRCKKLNLNPQANYVHLTLGKIRIAEGSPQQALAEIEKEPSEWGQFTGQALAYHALGREQDSNAALARLIAKYRTYAAYQIAQVYAYRGESDKSFEWLERAYQQRDPGLPELKSNPLFKNLRHDPRYSELLKRMRLPL